MEEIQGMQEESLKFIPKKLGDFLYYDGPLLSHFVDEERPNDNYLYRWVDNDEELNRWLIFKVSTDDLIDFFEEKCSLRNLIEFSKFVTILDLDNELNKRNIVLTTVERLPNSYLPSASSNFKSKFYHKYAIQLKENLIENRNRNRLTSKLVSKVDKLESQQSIILSVLIEFLEDGSNREKPFELYDEQGINYNPYEFIDMRSNYSKSKTLN